MNKDDVLHDMNIMQKALKEAREATHKDNWFDVEWFLLDLYNGSEGIIEAIRKEDGGRDGHLR